MAEQNPAIFFQDGAHPAEDVRRFIQAVVGTQGVAGAADLGVSEAGAPDLSVDVAEGGAFIRGDVSTYQGTYFVDNRGTTNVPIDGPSATARVDRVIGRIYDVAEGDAASEWVLEVVTGTPGAGAPALPQSAVSLAVVAVAPGATSITDADITDTRSVKVYANDLLTDITAIQSGQTTQNTNIANNTTATAAAQTTANTANTTANAANTAAAGAVAVNTTQNTTISGHTTDIATLVQKTSTLTVPVAGITNISDARITLSASTEILAETDLIRFGSGNAAVAQFNMRAGNTAVRFGTTTENTMGYNALGFFFCRPDVTAVSTNPMRLGSAAGNYAKTFVISSSRRWKRDIEAIDSAKADAFISAIEPSTFKSDIEADHNYTITGFIAEDVAEADPLLAAWDYTEYDDEGNGIGDLAPSGVDYNGILAHAVSVIQDLQARVAELEAQ